MNIEEVIQEKNLQECTEELPEMPEDHMPRPVKKKKRGKGADDYRKAERIAASLLTQKNGEQFRKLYCDGDISDYESASEADCALCSMIACRTGPDPGLIDSVFRASALMREEWEQKDYRENTIQKGIDACHGTFHRSKMPHPEFIRFDEMTGKPYVVPALLAEHVRQNVRYLLVRDSGKQALLKYVYVGGVYRLYADEMFKGVIKRFVEEYDPELVKMRNINEAYQQIITDLNYIGQEDLNADETLINFKNCLLRMDEQTLNPVPHAELL